MNLTSLEIPRSEWSRFFDDLSKEYFGWSLTIEVLGELGDQPAVENLALQAVTYEREGSDAGSILLDAGDMGSVAVVHRIAKPERVLVAELQPGNETDLQITGADATTIVHLRRRPGLPPRR